MTEKGKGNTYWETAFRDDSKGCENHKAYHGERDPSQRLKQWNELLFQWVPEKDAGKMRYLAQVEKTPTPTVKSPKLAYCIGVSFFCFFNLKLFFVCPIFNFCFLFNFKLFLNNLTKKNENKFNSVKHHVVLAL